MDIEDRVKYYMGNWYDTKITITDTDKYKYVDNSIVVDIILLLNIHIIKNNTFLKGYSKYLIDNSDILNNNKFLYACGDIIHTSVDLPVICKATDLTHKHIIGKLNHERHWSAIMGVKSNDIDFLKKRNSIVWRGATTNYETKFNRKTLVNRFYNHPLFDIGFSECVQDVIVDDSQLKNFISMKEHLKYKFILSVEGNDVASGLKWQLYSNSVVIMAKPTCVSWAMEDTLIPYVHYLPVKDDYSDLEEVFQWGLTHEKECIAITRAATTFIKQFLNKANEKEIHRRILQRYIDNITFK